VAIGKKELTRVLAEKTGLPQKQTAAFLDALTVEIGARLADGDQVKLTGFGTFSTQKRAARQGKNPATGANIQIPASVSPIFKAGKELKEKVNR